MSRELSYAPLDADGQVPLDRLDNAPGGAHPDLATHDALGLVTDAELTTHAADATAVHGIADTSLLSTTAHDHDADYEAAGGIATHSADTSSVHGITDATVLATDAEVATAVSDHSADTTAVHGITDTAALSLTSHDHNAAYEALGATATHAGLADPHTGYQKESEKSAASGYASLDAGTKVPIAELPTGTTGTTVALGNAAAGLITTHEAAGNPHPTYETAAEVLAQIGTHEGLANPHPGYLTPAEGDAAYQPLDSDLTAIAALTTTAFGRGLLALADAAALGAAHSHSGATTTYAPGSFTVATGNYALMVKRLQLTTTQRATIAGTARLRLS